MYPLEVVLIMSSTAMLLVTALLLIVRTMPSRSGLECWLVASFVQAVIYVVAYFNYPEPPSVAGNIIFQSLQTIAVLAMSIGTLKFIGQKVTIKRRFVFSVLVIVAIAVSRLNDFTDTSNTIFAVFAALMLFEVAYRLLKIKDSEIEFKITATLFIINGIHWLDYPILSHVVWFVPIGFMIGMMLAVSIFMSLSALSLLQFKRQTKESERKAIQAAIHDPLTGLYNRSHLDQLFSEYAEEAEQIQRPFILLYFDLDGFKQVNDTYGHIAGDLILTTISQRMSKWLGAKGDAVRIGGDELLVLTRLRANFTSENSLTAARRLLHLIEQPILDGANTHSISASVGGCCYGFPHCDLDSMIHESDSLMYEVKQAGGRNIKFAQFETDLHKPKQAKAVNS